MDSRWIIRLIITDRVTGRHQVFRTVVADSSLLQAFRTAIAECKDCHGDDVNITDQNAEAC